MTRKEELEKLITDAQTAYYNTESSALMSDAQQTISDYEFDRLVDELSSIAPDSAVLKRIGADYSVEFKKIRHVFPVMGSQKKATDVQDFTKWIVSAGNERTYIVELKLDGASVEIVYDKGRIVRAVTRGNGVEGDIITKNVLRMKGIRRQIDSTFSGAIRGEVILPRSTFIGKYSDKKNPRNCAAGIMKRLSGEGCEDLMIITYDVVCTEYTGNQPVFNTELDKLAFLEKNKFNVVPYTVVTGPPGNNPDVWKKEIHDRIWYKLRKSYMEEREAIDRKFDYDYDGLVVKTGMVHLEDYNRDRPEFQIAIKFDFDEKETYLRAVEWSVNGKRRTPVAVFDTVHLCGTDVSRASLANPRILKELDVKIGSKITVSKRGEIIPKVIAVDRKTVTKNQTPVIIPVKCEICGTVLVQDDASLYCPNDDCPETKIHRIEKWISVHGIQYLGRQMLNFYIAAGVESISDLYIMELSDLIKVGMGEAMAAKTLIEIEKKSLETTIPKFIAGFDIDGVGETIIEKIVRHYHIQKVEDLYALDVLNLIAVPGIGETTAIDIMKGIESNKDEMMAVLKHVTIKSDSGVSGGKLLGKVFVFTGKLLNGLTRDQAMVLVKTNGGEVASIVSKHTSYVVTDSDKLESSKAVKADKLGVPIISGSAFMHMVEG